MPPELHERARELGTGVHEVLEEEAARLRPGESGLLALDWWNGNRSVLVDADLRGLLVGMTLATTAPEIYRALIEATAFGTRVIVDAFEDAGVPVERIVACGGLPDRNRLLMQIYADVDRPRVRASPRRARPPRSARRCSARSRRAPRAAATTRSSTPRGGWRTCDPRRTGRSPRITPSTTACTPEYVRLHDLFGRGGDDVMRTLKRIQREA